ncbi:hypothetical protein [Paraburkholderia sacchari]|uniref:hypothetical protein n=1 Tax=Paraburkholderia sacchari TaxID=159450 RepID=UPI001BCA766D|nr:hypothetical protein [Paraburkholderia sacchari]
MSGTFFSNFLYFTEKCVARKISVIFWKLLKAARQQRNARVVHADHESRHQRRRQWRGPSPGKMRINGAGPVSGSKEHGGNSQEQGGGAARW